jgi:SpoVK/Ycf46/Vps4 family AAA+-type ATPase
MEAAIESEIIAELPDVQFSDIAGMEDAKQAIMEMVVMPAKRPDLYTGLRSPGKGVLLYGPPGTGKTMLAKAVASAAGTTFISVSASRCVAMVLALSFV